MNNKVAIYVRVSTDEQRDNGYSIDSQLRMLKEYADKNNYNIVGIYNDAGYSGKNLMRPEMQRLLKDIEDGKSGHLPPHLKNTYSFDGKVDAYKYPHDYPAAWVYQQYLPDEIIDAKYYGNSLQQQYDKYSIISGNLYQIFTYVKNHDKDSTGNVAGILLYAKTDEDITPDCMFNMGGNQIGAKTLDLNKDFKLIAAQLDKLVEDFFGENLHR